MSSVKNKKVFICYFHFARISFFDILMHKREMKTRTLLLTVILSACPGIAAAASCSVMNLTRCLDSVCAINVSSNPSARCQYCGTSIAGEPPSQRGGMVSLSVGASARYTISEDELEDAPTDPGQRYAWATAKCIEKIDGCTPDDVTDNYDKLIEQSCRAAGVSAQLAATLADRAKPSATLSSCTTSIRACMIAANRCGSDWSNCADDASFDEFLSTCGVQENNCSEFMPDVRTAMTEDRDSAIANAGALIENIIKGYQKAREQKLASARHACTDGTSRTNCVETVCERNMPNKCGQGYESERVNAELLCEFYDLACELLDLQ